MLDTYIIEQIRKQREQQRRDGGFLPLRIEVPQEPPGRERPDMEDDRHERRDRGSVIIDFGT